MQVCRYCGKEFETEDQRRQYCSILCSAKSLKQAKNRANKKFYRKRKDALKESGL